MSNTITVADSSPLILLSKIGKLELLKNLYGKLFIPQAVYEETIQRGKELEHPDAYIIEKAIGTWLIIQTLNPQIEHEYSFIDNNKTLGKGEKQGIKLCKQLDANYFLSDDKEARKVSKMLNIRPIGTIGTVIQCQRQNIIIKKQAVQIVDDLINAGLRIDTILYRRILNELNIQVS